MRKITVLFDRFGTIRIVAVRMKKKGLYLKQTPVKYKKQKMLETAIEFARMWGVAETLNDADLLSQLNFQNYIKEWAKEFISKKENNKTEFFEKQLKKLRNRE